MVFWLLAAVMTVIALGFVLVPMLRRGVVSASRADHDLTIYRDQLKELEADVARGVVTGDDATAARLEIQRRMLAVDKKQQAEGAPTRVSRGGVVRWIGVGFLVLAVPAMAVALYLSMGTPGLPSQPLAERDISGQTQQAATEGIDINEAIVGLKARLAEDPADLEGWLMLGRTFMTLERYDEAIISLRQAASISRDEPAIQAMLAEAMVLGAGGMITAEATQLFEAVLAASPDDPAARYYLGLAFAQSGRVQMALDMWIDLAADTPIDAPWRAHIVGAIEKGAAEIGVEVADIPAAPAMGAGAPPVASVDKAGERGPSAEDMAAAADMSPEDRLEMIRGMVAQLATRLAENPDDIAGWERLARAYQVLGEDEKAAAAEARLAALRARDAGSTGPDADDVAAAADMTTEDRSAMIRSMVGKLAARLEENPDDLEGWLRLAQSWQVLGEYQKAVNAFGRAVDLSPDDAVLLGDYGRALIEATPDAVMIPEQATAVFNRALAIDPDYREALWFTGYAAAQAGDVDTARTRWTHLLSLLPTGTEDHTAVQQALESL